MPESSHSAFSPAQRVMITQTLRKAPMFSGISADALQALVEGCRLLKYGRGEYLFHEGETADGFYVVHAGAVNVHRVTEDGREQVIRVFYPGESLGEVVIVGDQTYPAAAKATENSQVILVPTDFFRRRIQADPDLALRILASMSLHLRYLVESVESLKLNQAESRVVQWLLSQLEESGQAKAEKPEFTLPLAKHLLASQLGITSETLSRVFSRLREKQLAVIEGRRLRELDVAGLRRYLVEVETKG
ncbi:MAG: Crp/Fnr family transcriptional regulator [Opitutales bacterium]